MKNWLFLGIIIMIVGSVFYFYFYYKSESYYSKIINVYHGKHIEWWMTQAFADQHSVFLSTFYDFADIYWEKATIFMNYNFSGNHYLGNYSSPIGTKIGCYFFEGDRSDFRSSGHGEYRPEWAVTDYPYIGLKTSDVEIKIGSSFLSTSRDIQGYTAYLNFAHEFMGMFDFYSFVNVPWGWAADGKSPFARAFLFKPLNLVAKEMGGSIGEDLTAMAQWEKEYSENVVKDEGVIEIDKWLEKYGMDLAGKIIEVVQDEKLCLGWTIYNNKSGNYPILTNTALKSAYFQIYWEYCASNTSLNWDWGYIPQEQNNVTLRRALHEVHKYVVDCKNIIELTMNATIKSEFNKEYDYAMRFWREGNYIQARSAFILLYNKLKSKE